MRTGKIAHLPNKIREQLNSSKLKTWPETSNKKPIHFSDSSISACSPPSFKTPKSASDAKSHETLEKLSQQLEPQSDAPDQRTSPVKAS